MGAALVAILAGLLLPLSAQADGDSYRQGIEQARLHVRDGFAGRTDAAREAIAVLRSTTGDTQSAAIADLEKRPPDFAQADQRLAAAAAALDRPGRTAEPAEAKARLHAILAQSRYAGLNAQQSPWDRFRNWALTQLAGWLASLHLEAIPLLFWYSLLGVAALVAVGVTLLIVRSSWSRAGRARTRREEAAIQASRDRFAEAADAAQRGEFTQALRSLVAGVATDLSGRPYWESSPLTVRELFRGHPHFDLLRPLLVDFERAVYGGRPISAEEYRSAEKIAAKFRAVEAEPTVAA